MSLVRSDLRYLHSWFFHCLIVFQASFYKLWKRSIPELRIPAENRFSKCTMCSFVKEKLSRIDLPDTARAHLHRYRQVHLSEAQRERDLRTRHKQKSKREPDQYLYMSMDAMDSNKFLLPQLRPIPKDADLTLAFCKPSLVNVIDSYGHYNNYVCPEEFPNDSNQSATCLLLALTRLSNKFIPRRLYLHVSFPFRLCTKFIIDLLVCFFSSFRQTIAGGRTKTEPWLDFWSGWLCLVSSMKSSSASWWLVTHMTTTINSFLTCLPSWRSREFARLTVCCNWLSNHIQAWLFFLKPCKNGWMSETLWIVFCFLYTTSASLWISISKKWKEQSSFVVDYFKTASIHHGCQFFERIHLHLHNSPRPPRLRYLHDKNNNIMQYTFNCLLGVGHCWEAQTVLQISTTSLHAWEQCLVSMVRFDWEMATGGTSSFPNQRVHHSQNRTAKALSPQATWNSIRISTTPPQTSIQLPGKCWATSGHNYWYNRSVTCCFDQQYN